MIIYYIHHRGKHKTSLCPFGASIRWPVELQLKALWYQQSPLVVAAIKETNFFPQALDLQEAGGHLLGYQVSYEPVKRQTLVPKSIHNVTEPNACLVVEEGYCIVTVGAYNMAGVGPAAHLSINTNTQNSKWPSLRV